MNELKVFSNEVLASRYNRVLESFSNTNFNSDIRKLDPKVAEPLVKTLPTNYKEILTKAYESMDKEIKGNDDSMEASAKMSQTVIDACVEKAKQSSTSEEATYWMDRAKEERQAYSEKDTENKNFKFNMSFLRVGLAAFGFWLIGKILGTTKGPVKSK